MNNISKLKLSQKTTYTNFNCILIKIFNTSLYNLILWDLIFLKIN